MDDPVTRVKVMVVEDDPEVAKAIARKLGGDGLDVELADDPRPVLARLEAGEGNDWDVVLLDVGLPGMSGIDVLHRFRESTSLASVVMLTGDNSANTATTCMPPLSCWSARRRRCASCARRSIGSPARMSRS